LGLKPENNESKEKSGIPYHKAFHQIQKIKFKKRNNWAIGVDIYWSKQINHLQRQECTKRYILYEKKQLSNRVDIYWNKTICKECTKKDIFFKKKKKAIQLSDWTFTETKK